MRKPVLIFYGGCVIILAIGAFELSRHDRPTNEAEFERLAAFDFKDGRREAEADLAHGCPRWITYGGPAFDVGPSTATLDRSLGLKRDHIAYCTVPPGAERYTREYNRVIFDHLVRTYGRHFVLSELLAAGIPPPI